MIRIVTVTAPCLQKHQSVAEVALVVVMSVIATTPCPDFGAVEAGNAAESIAVS